MTPIKTWSTVIGHAAMVIILTAYIAFAWGFLGKVPYVATGLLTSVMMGFHAWERKSYPVLSMNGAWFAISVIGLVRG
jgi:hypothetical protein